MLAKLPSVGRAKEPSEQRSMLHFAAMHGDVDLISALCAPAVGAMPSEPDRNGYTPLLLAIVDHHWPAVELLLRDVRLEEVVSQQAAEPPPLVLRGRQIDAAADKREHWEPPALHSAGISRVIAAIAAGRLASLRLSEGCTFEPWQYDALAAACATDAARGALDLIDADGRGLELRPAELKAKTDVTYLQQELGDAGACIVARLASAHCQKLRAR